MPRRNNRDKGKKKAEIIDLAGARSKKILQEPDVDVQEEEGSFVQCPHCGGIEWAVILDDQTGMEVTHLVCISEECDGDSWGEVENGIVSEEIYHYDP